MTMYKFIELAESNGKVASYISAAINAEIIGAGGFATTESLNAIEAVVELKNELEEENAPSTKPSYKQIYQRLQENGEAVTPSKSTIKRAIDIVFLRQPKNDNEGNYPNTVDIDTFLLKNELSNPITELIAGKRSSLEIIEQRVIEYLIPLVEAKIDGFSFAKATRTLALAIKFRLVEPEISTVRLQRYVMGKTGRPLSFGQAHTATKFSRDYANGTALTEIQIQKIIRHIESYVRIQRRSQTRIPLPYEVIEQMSYHFILGLYQHAVKVGSYIHLDDIDDFQLMDE
ncbi:hypothetical protein [Maribrevibacterium harenarium]|nr:hypothetical protein [Maribrevibacterium harenarium]